MKQLLVKEKLFEYSPGGLRNKQFPELHDFVDAFLNNLNNPIVMNMYVRMLDDNSFTKHGAQAFNFSPEELEKLNEIKPSLYDLLYSIREIYRSIN